MNVQQIEKLEEVIDLPNGHTITAHKIKRLTAAGDNYGSLMLSVDITVQTPNGTEEIHAVAKLVPPNDFIQEMFNTQVTYRNEIGFYKQIIPALRKFQKDNGVENVIDFFPEYYGSRINLNNDDASTVDSNAALMLQNLKPANFVNLDRIVGCDVAAAKLILTDMAYLHAVPLALKLKNPEIFESKIKPYLAPYRLTEQGHASLSKRICKLAENLDEIRPLRERIRKGFDKIMVPSEPREPWATITHNDCWVNNNMVKFEQSKPVKNKMVDFQVCDYGSPAKDIVFFLYSSLQTPVLEKYYDELLMFYYKTFISILQELDCNTDFFSFDSFLKELDIEAEKSQFGHIAFMLFGIFAPPGSVKELDQLSPEDLGQHEPTDLHKEKMIFVVKEFDKRNWI